MQQSLKRTLDAMQTAMFLTVATFLWNAALITVGYDSTITFAATLAVVAGGTAALVGPGLGASAAFLASSVLAGHSWSAALLPAAVIVLYRVVRRVIMLDQQDKTAPREPHLGFWRNLQAWVGWSAR